MLHASLKTSQCHMRAYLSRTERLSVQIEKEMPSVLFGLTIWARRHDSNWSQTGSGYPSKAIGEAKIEKGYHSEKQHQHKNQNQNSDVLCVLRVIIWMWNMDLFKSIRTQNQRFRNVED